MRTKSKPIKVW